MNDPHFCESGRILNILYSSPDEDLTTTTHIVLDSYAVSLSLYRALELVGPAVLEGLIVIVIVCKIATVFRIAVTADQIVAPYHFASVYQVVTVYRQPLLVSLEDSNFQVWGVVLVV